MGAVPVMPLASSPAQEAWRYWRDACQRAVQFSNVMRQRGNNYLENRAKTAAHALRFDGALVVDGRKLARR
jgi:hypothetical protein